MEPPETPSLQTLSKRSATVAVTRNRHIRRRTVPQGADEVLVPRSQGPKPGAQESAVGAFEEDGGAVVGLCEELSRGCVYLEEVGGFVGGVDVADRWRGGGEGEVVEYVSQFLREC